ncbi:MAG: class I SAM-dependent methyltransferase [Opitutales bacterium]
MRLTEQVHRELEKAIRPGDTAIDATAGNGHDTQAMARLVGSSGKVIAIDLQAAAIASTRSRLRQSGQLAVCELIEGNHANILHALLPEHRASIAAITFNLGYLPGGEKTVTTSAISTLRALDATISLLKAAGILLVTAYRGHSGGLTEANEVATWMRTLSHEDWKVELREPPTRHPDRVPPILWIASKLRH